MKLRFRRFTGTALACVFVGCAVPHGLGPIPPTGSIVAAGGGGAGVDRGLVQGVVKLNLHTADEPRELGFNVGLGALYTALVAFDGAIELHGFLPFVEPGFAVDDFRLGVPLSGFGIGGGEFGILYGLAGLSVAYVADRVTFGGTGYVYALDLTADPSVQTSAQVVSVTFTYYVPLDDAGEWSLALGADVAAGNYSLEKGAIDDQLDGLFMSGIAYVGIAVAPPSEGG